MKVQGFSLVELMVAIAICGILLAVAVPQFSRMNKKSGIEKQTRELYAAISNARLTAMLNKKATALYLGPQQCVFKVYTSLNDGITTAWKTVSTTNFQYIVKQKDVSGSGLNDLNVSTNKIEFNARGMADNIPIDQPVYLVVTPTTYSGGRDCIVVQFGRTNIGRMEDASTCTIQ